MLRITTGLAALFILMAATGTAFGQTSVSPRVTGLYTTWDDYYFYFAVQVHDLNVLGSNSTPTSQPQQDDDIELFFETDNARATVRTANSYQMAVSPAGGSYFSVGDGTKIPRAKVIYTCKYAATVDGTLNDSTDKDTGYTVEVAIPWQELGQSGPPKDGTVWGFNVLSRERTDAHKPAGSFYSLSPGVTARDDVQNPSKWARIKFTRADAAQDDSGDVIDSPRIVSRFPLINGQVTSGEWPSASRRSFGDSAVAAGSPTVQEEPNTSESPFAELPPNVNPASQPAPKPEPSYPASISLPGGGSIKVVPGGIKAADAPPIPVAPVPAAPNSSGIYVNPLTPKPRKGYQPPAPESTYTGSLALSANKPSPLIVAAYRLDLNGDSRRESALSPWTSTGASALTDQPINGTGPWVSGLRALWHKQQLTELRRAGIEIALVKPCAGDASFWPELDALVEALKEMKRQNIDYPLIGIEQEGMIPVGLNDIHDRIPAEFRAMVPADGSNERGLLVVARAPHGFMEVKVMGGLPLIDISTHATIATVSPGTAAKSGITSRNGGSTYQEAWKTAIESHSDYVYIDSWNDFANGSEVAGSRQYGEKYADQTRIWSIALNGDKEWHAKYLANDVPRILLPKKLYTVSFRVENAGTLPWRAGEGYSLCPRWYRDGRLFDDSAPRIPISIDVMPGQTATLSTGFAARNSFGEDLEPGQYTLVFDMVQGADRWFSYALDSPLQLSVTVAAAGNTDSITPLARFIETDTPTGVQGGATYHAHVSVRNDGSTPWVAKSYRLTWEINSEVTTAGKPAVYASGEAPLAVDTDAGDTAIVDVPILVADSAGKAPPNGGYVLRWAIKGPGDAAVIGGYTEPLWVTGADTGASFVLDDIPRNMTAGGEAVSRLAVRNIGNAPWPKSTTKVGAHWYYLDGVEAAWDGGPLTPLKTDVKPGALAADVITKVRAPSRPGRYALVWDVLLSDGTWASTNAFSKDNDLLQVFVNVTGKGNGVTPVDLVKYANAGGVSAFGDSMGIPFTGGQGFPAEFLPPDGTSEVNANPLLLGKAASQLYPSGYYSARTGDGWNSNHGIPFHYPQKIAGAMNLVSCSGQEISIPGGKYRTIHILAAATGGEKVSASFSLNYDGGAVAQPVEIDDWSRAPEGPQVTVGLQAPYRLTDAGAEPNACYLGDYAIAANSDKTLHGIVLPQSPGVKIVAITLEK